MVVKMNLPRKGNLAIGDFSNLPVGAANDYMASNKTSPSVAALPLSNNVISNANDAGMANLGNNLFHQNHYNQAMNSYALQSRQFPDSMENLVKQKFNAVSNPNMAAAAASPYARLFDSNSSDGYPYAMARMPATIRNPDMFNVNKSLEQSNYAQQRNMSNNIPWSVDFAGRNNGRRSLPVKPGMSQQGLPDPNLGQNMSADHSFASRGIDGLPQQQPYPFSSPFIPGDVYKQSCKGEQQFGGRGNFHHQDVYQQEQMRQVVNQYQQSQLPLAAGTFFAANQRNSPSPFSQSALQKPTHDAMYAQQFSAATKANGPHHMMNMMDERQVQFPNVNYPVSPAGSQMSAKPAYTPPLPMRGTVSPNVTIGLPKKPYRPQEEAVTSPGNNQNAAAAAAAAAVLAAVNKVNTHTSPQSTNDIHNIPSLSPNIHNVPSRPPSIHGKEPGSRSPATSLSDHKSESGGSVINDMPTTPSPGRSFSRNTPQLSDAAAAVNFTSDVETGRVPSPSVNQLPSSDIEAMIQSVSNIGNSSVVASNGQTSMTSFRIKSENKSDGISKVNARLAASPVSPPSPFSLSPSIGVDIELDILSPSWEDPSSRCATPLHRLYKLSDEPGRKEFLDNLVAFMEEQGKGLSEVPNISGVPLDLFKLFKMVSERGGMQEVTRLKLWTEIGVSVLNCGETESINEQTLREHYIRLLLPFEEKMRATRTSLPPLSASSSVFSASPSLAKPEAGNIDLSAMTYKNMSMFQHSPNLPTPAYNQGAPQSSSHPPSYSGTPPSSQGYPSTPPVQLPSSGYRNVPQALPPGYPTYPQGSPRVPSYPGGHANFGGVNYGGNHYLSFSGTPPQMSGYQNNTSPSRYPNYASPRNTVPPEAMFMRDPHAQIPRPSSLGMNKPYQNLVEQQAQLQGMFPNYPQQSQHPSGYMFQQQASSMPSYQMERQRITQGSRGGMGSPRQRIHSMQSSWNQRYSDSSSGMSPGHSSTFHASPSPGLKMTTVRPPPPYPHAKPEKPSPTTQSSASAALQYQALKSSVKLSPVKKEEELFPAGCVEVTQAIHTKKRRLTARDIGPVEAWRIMMSLKSGLLAETAWALDTLTILLSDDATVGFFRLGHLPGFLDTVVEHFRRNLINVFAVLKDSEIDTGAPERFTYGSTIEKDQGERFRDRLPDLVATENFSAIIVGDCLGDENDWGFCSGRKNWAQGGGDTTIHIQTHFETDPQFFESRHKETDLCLASENRCKDEPVDDSSHARNTGGKGSKETHIRSGSDDGTPFVESSSSANDCGKPEEEQSDDVTTNVNGIPSPQSIKCDAKRPTCEIAIGRDSLKPKTEVDDSKAENCCTGNSRADFGSVKLEPGSAGKEEPSALLIKRLKAELDLDVEAISDDSSDISSDAQTCDMRVADIAEDECELKQEFPLSSVTLSQDSAMSCCKCVSNIVRNLSFVPGNDMEMAKHPSLLLILAKLLLLHHKQRRKRKQSCSDSQYNDTDCWWRDCLDILRENTLVTVANIAGYLDFSLLVENVSAPLLDGLLHWLVCQATVADEPLRTTSASVCLTPKHLVLETLAKLSVSESNVDFMLNSSNKTRLSKVYEFLVKLFSDKSNEVTREFALVLLSSFTQANHEICSSCSERSLVTVLVGFLEDARDRVESMAVRGLHPGMFRDNDLRVSMGMLRRASGLLACISKRTRSNHLIPFQERILALSISRALDSEVQSHLSNVLYNLTR